MNAHQLLSDFELGPGDRRATLLQLKLFVRYLADNLYEATLNSGERVSDATAFKLLLHELAEEVRMLAGSPHGTEVSLTLECGTRSKVTPPPPQQRWNPRICPDCDHEHEGREECGKYLGENRFCHCPSKVAA
jgi:hypothetical protein